MKVNDNVVLPDKSYVTIEVIRGSIAICRGWYLNAQPRMVWLKDLKLIDNKG